MFLYPRSGFCSMDGVLLYLSVFFVCMCVRDCGSVVISRLAVLSIPVISVQPVFVSGSLGALCSVGSGEDLLFKVRQRAVLLMKTRKYKHQKETGILNRSKLNYNKWF